MITYPVQQGTLWAILQESTGEIISRNKPWPDANGNPVPTDPGFVYLLQVTDAQPEYDPRLYTMASTETIDIEANEIRTSWEAVARPIGDIEINIANTEAEQNERQIPAREVMAMTVSGLAILFRQIENQVLTARETRIKDRILKRANAIKRNDARHAELKTAARAGQTLDMDKGWAPIEPDEA